ncbi:monovalent cation/H+ antiporter subunit D [Advenella alkanexedens]|uniref:Monovalent cation/H+ antiporter subunit D n=1 Tax=Advenella alkanexedens TaxID=1481665 RepID=A0ABS6NNT4_9BURK|nr:MULTISPECIES: monovalent cation/H+ antiporter subunit D [Advenella]MBV4397270.1 monovalent cation/H+ antiporter subunit D [Advenella alkanexedens]MDD3757791.1 monovalent cation/H+ antiporter subunit D [Advenella sp.]NLY34403.1 monovalent cation/H+ antiporter subunit D [Alcaligenaceae bacterium]
MMGWLDHLPILPVAVPMMAGALMLLLKDSRRKALTGLAFLSVTIQFAVAVTLLFMTAGDISSDWNNDIGVYLLGNWIAPFGIVFVVDKLSAVMLVLTIVLGICALIYSTAFWDRVGIHFHPLFQFILMGLNGAFLTGDLFNLFVFFEIFLAASYGLLLHGSGSRRVSSGLHYITVNLIGASLLLISISLIYGVTGTLNMADLGIKAGMLDAENRKLFETACAILGIAFLVKAAAWPLNFWLPNAYAAACAPVATLFAIMTKVGIYALVRMGSLLLPTGAPAAFGGDWMYAIGLGTLLFGTLGILAEKNTGRLVGYSIILSSGTLLTALGMPGVTLTGPSLFYLISSVLTTGAFFMLVELIKRTESFGSNVLSVSFEAFGLDEDKTTDYSGDVVGVAIPAALAFLGLSFFTCAILIACMPPFSGFVAKFALLSSALELTDNKLSGPSLSAWLLVIAMLASGLATVIALGKSGVRLFWNAETLQTPKLSIREAIPVSVLLLSCIALSIFAGPVMDFLAETASSLDDPNQYINAVITQASNKTMVGGH